MASACTPRKASLSVSTKPRADDSADSSPAWISSMLAMTSCVCETHAAAVSDCREVM